MTSVFFHCFCFELILLSVAYWLFSLIWKFRQYMLYQIRLMFSPRRASHPPKRFSCSPKPCRRTILYGGRSTKMPIFRQPRRPQGYQSGCTPRHSRCCLLARNGSVRAGRPSCPTPTSSTRSWCNELVVGLEVWPGYVSVGAGLTRLARSAGDVPTFLFRFVFVMESNDRACEYSMTV